MNSFEKENISVVFSIEYKYITATMGKKKKEPTKVYGFRLPVRLLEKLSQIAAEEYRSLNGQVLKILEDWVKSNEKDEGRKR